MRMLPTAWPVSTVYRRWLATGLLLLGSLWPVIGEKKFLAAAELPTALADVEPDPALPRAHWAERWSRLLVEVRARHPDRPPAAAWREFWPDLRAWLTEADLPANALIEWADALVESGLAAQREAAPTVLLSIRHALAEAERIRTEMGGAGAELGPTPVGALLAAAIRLLGQVHPAHAEAGIELLQRIEAWDLSLLPPHAATWRRDLRRRPIFAAASLALLADRPVATWSLSDLGLLDDLAFAADVDPAPAVSRLIAALFAGEGHADAKHREVALRLALAAPRYRCRLTDRAREGLRAALRDCPDSDPLWRVLPWLVLVDEDREWVEATRHSAVGATLQRVSAAVDAEPVPRMPPPERALLPFGLLVDVALDEDSRAAAAALIGANDEAIGAERAEAQVVALKLWVASAADSSGARAALWRDPRGGAEPAGAFWWTYYGLFLHPWALAQGHTRPWPGSGSESDPALLRDLVPSVGHTGLTPAAQADLEAALAAGAVDPALQVPALARCRFQADVLTEVAGLGPWLERVLRPAAGADARLLLNGARVALALGDDDLAIGCLERVIAPGDQASGWTPAHSLLLLASPEHPEVLAARDELTAQAASGEPAAQVLAWAVAVASGGEADFPASAWLDCGALPSRQGMALVLALMELAPRLQPWARDLRDPRLVAGWLPVDETMTDRHAEQHAGRLGQVELWLAFLDRVAAGPDWLPVRP